MSTQLSLTSKFGQALWSEWSALQNEPSSAWSRLKDVRGLVAVWRERRYYRRELKRLAKDGPQLIDDIGLTMRIVEAEIQKPFWQA
jgi:uncharacterized protein YjiS (DUF1127 family)